ncbi:MAG: hypothetical protein V7752_16515 [Halopseudomonas sp.]
MKALLLVSVVALVIGGCQAGGPAVNSEPGSFTMIKGEAWSNVQIGGQPPSTTSLACYYSDCYASVDPVNLSVELKRKYQLKGTSFDALAMAAGVSRQGDTLTLPGDLGWELYSEARAYERRSNFQ